MAWTKEQQLAIDKDHSNIIVSAGAGSGKTAVLTARVIRKLKDGSSINRLLILTFTKEAAKEMKLRIRNQIMANESLKPELDLIDQAYITTFDSYALTVVQKYHYLLNITKNVNIIDETIINRIKANILDKIFNKYYEENNPEFLKLIQDFCSKDDQSIKNYLLKIYNKLDLKLDKEKYLNSYLENFYHKDNIAKLIQAYLDLIQRKKNSLIKMMEDLAFLDDEYYQKFIPILKSLADANTYLDIKGTLTFSLPRLPRNAENSLKLKKEKIKKEQEKLQKLVKYSDLKEIEDNLLLTKDYVSIIIKILKDLDEEVIKEKRKQEIYEFVDIEKLAINILKDHEDVLNEIKNDYDEIMVDEYQDTSDLQEEFISLIENNNVYMVGDIKQSIYRFRNANPVIFKNKYLLYEKKEKGIKIDLLKNFRSREEVLRDINLIFDSCMDLEIGGADYQKSHEMVFGNTVYENEGKTVQDNSLEIYNYDVLDKTFTNEEKEAFIIASDIKMKIANHYQVLDKETNTLKDASYKDFCIIMDRGTSFTLYKKVFEYLNIPLSIYKDEDLTSDDLFLIIKNILGLIIKYLKKEIDKEYKFFLVSILRSYLIGMNDKEIFNIFYENKFTDNIVINKIQKIIKDINEDNLYQITEKIIKEFNFYEKLILVGDIDKNIIRIDEIISLAKSLNDLGYTLEDFFSYLEDVNDASSELRYNLTDTTSESVKIMNIHKSKGLEFPICYYSGLYKKFNNADEKDRIMISPDYEIITPVFKEGIQDTILKTLVKEKNNKEEISEKIRLFYVALTRAREKMIIVMPTSSEEVNSSYIIDKDIRLKYSSLKDIVDSVMFKIKKYVKNIDLEKTFISKDYKKIKDTLNDNNFIKEEGKITEINLNIEDETLEEEHYSKQSHGIITLEDKQKLDFGNNLHYLFEIEDFLNPVNEYVKKFVKHFNDLDKAKIYKEYEFMSDGNKGIIDLMIENEKEIKIIDYKTNNIKDEAYLNQLNGYKEFISKKTSKVIKLYLYSILSDVLEEVR